MEILVALGECFDADSMIPIHSAHLLYSLNALGKGGVSLIQEMAKAGGKFRVYTDTNPSGSDPCYDEALAIPEEFTHRQKAIARTMAQMGALLNDTCTPYLVGHVPAMGQHIAWNESSAVVFANSVLGAKGNREGGPSAFAAAITGRVPNYGYHLKQSRYGQLKIVVSTRLRHPHDYGTLGYFVGKPAADKVPVFVGIPASVGWDELKQLSAAIATSGSVGLFHIVGVTPEAPSEEAAFGGGKIRESQVIEFGEKELLETQASLSDARRCDPDLVILGCPHASLSELRKISQALRGKKLCEGVEMWVVTSRMIRAPAESMGYLAHLRQAGAKVLCNTCPVWLFKNSMTSPFPRLVATDSAKLTYAMNDNRTSQQDIHFYYGSVEECVRAATSRRKREA